LLLVVVRADMDILEEVVERADYWKGQWFWSLAWRTRLLLVLVVLSKHH
jgi:hypothetical protein